LKWAVVSLCLVGCLSSSDVVCEDGRICPGNTTCRELPAILDQLCATDEQLAACMTKAQFEPCTLEGIASAHCYDGVCVETSCGNLRTDVGEQCDDGNANTGDGCSADCLSNETCGNGRVDAVTSEACDDSNNIAHDGCSSTCVRETLRWVERTVSPPGRAGGVTAYDPVRDRVVMFAGVGDSTLGTLGDVWEWDGAAWTELRGSTPPGRVDAAMAFDGANVMLFGGGNGLADTWTYDGRAWTSRLVTGPSPRFGHSMAYDAQRHRVVLFGGAVIDGGGTSNITDGLTWEWDGAVWTSRTTTNVPPPRRSAQMAYDPVRARIVLEGGSPSLDDTWVYDGTNWTNVVSSGGPERANAGTAFDVATGEIILFGGQQGAVGYTDQTLAWNGTSWIDRQVTGLSARAIANQIVATNDGVLAFSGTLGPSTPPRETWLLRGTAWTRATLPVTDATNMAPTGLDPGFVVAAHDAARGRIVLYDGYDDVIDGGDGASTWELSSSGWEKRTTTSPPARSQMSMAYDPIAKSVVMFGGQIGATALAETWTWNGSSWIQATPGTSPPARVGGLLAFDGRHLTLVGGTSPGFGARTDTWSWDGTTWTETTGPVHPGGLAGASGVGYDPIRNELVLLGTFAVQGVLTTETWGFDGTTWMKKSPMTQPVIQLGSPLVWNAARMALVLAGGNHATDAWVWDGTNWSHSGPEGLPPARDAATFVPALDGSGVLMYGGRINLFDFPGDQWELRWDAADLDERCDGTDADGDMQMGCADGDCWRVCSPSCGPGVTCSPEAPRCGDTVCDPVYESCETCAADCPCTAACGDFVCTMGETSCPGDCP
jgi:cysteine-rich repeat protein